MLSSIIPNLIRTPTGIRSLSKEETVCGMPYFCLLVLPWTTVRKIKHTTVQLITLFFLGVSHGDELIYMFTLPSFGNNETESVLSRRMIDVWTTFAKYG
jgi:hypothetical protein